MDKIVLKASAGTGKTYRLSIEYIVSLLKGESYQDILVMTFTKKATGEIKERIVEFLKKLTYEGEEIETLKEKDELLNSLLNNMEIKNKKRIEKGEKLIELNKEKLQIIQREISENSDKLKIYTIDGFINNIFKTVVAPYLGLENYTIGDDDHKERVIEELLGEILGNKNKFKIFKKFLEKRVERDIDSYKGIIETLLESRWKYFILKSNCFVSKKEIIKGGKENIIPIIDEIISHTKEMGIIKNGDETSVFNKKILESGYLQCELNKEKERYLKNYEFMEILKTSNIWDGRQTRKNEQKEILKEAISLGEQLKEEILIEIYNTEIISQEEDIYNFIGELYKTYDDIKFKDKKLTYTDVSTYTLEYYENEELGLLNNNGEISDYFQGIFNGKFKTLFIDEFQDTSILQWRLLHGISKKAQSIICVGDEKQSLYSWRGGEKKLFEKLNKLIGAEVETLDTSYRSKKGIVDYTNLIFENFKKQYYEYVDMNEPWEYNSVNSIKQGDFSVKIKYLLDIKEEMEDDAIRENELQDDEDLKTKEKNRLAISKLVEDIFHNFNGVYKGTAIIARGNQTLMEIGEVLSDYDIPYTIKGKDNIFNHRVNLGLKTILTYLSTNNFISLVEFLRGDLININLEELREVFTNKENIENYLKNTLSLKENDLNDKGKDNLNLQIKLNIKSEKIIKYLNDIKDLKDEYLKYNGDSRKISLMIFKKFNPLEIYTSSTDAKNYYKGFEILKNYQRIDDFLMDLRDNPNKDIFKQVSVEENNGIILTTIHGSKGLEYDTVIYFHKTMRSNKAQSLYFQMELDEYFEKPVSSIIYSGKYHKDMKELCKIFKRRGEKWEYNFIENNENKKLQEELNGWYVALTRAKNNLIIAFIQDETIDKKGKEKDYKDNLFLDFIAKQMDKERGNFIVNEIKSDLEDKNNENILKDKIKINFKKIEISPEKLHENKLIAEETYKNLKIESKNYKVIGTAIHYYLENLKDMSENSKKEAYEKTISQYGMEMGVENLSEILLGEKFKNELYKNNFLFDKSWDEVYNEYNIIDIKDKGKIKRIDRLMIKKPTKNSKGEILIIDYKTGEKDKEQIENYKKIIEDNLKKEELFNDYVVNAKFVMINI